MFLKQFDCIIFQIGEQGLNGGTDIRQAAFFSFGQPFIAVPVAVEDYTPVVPVILNNDIPNFRHGVGRGFKPVGNPPQHFRHCRGKYGIGPGYRLRGTTHSELEAVSGKGEGTGPVPVCHIHGKIRQGRNTYLKNPAFPGFHLIPRNQLLKNLIKLITEKYGDNGRRCFIRSKAVIVSRTGCRSSEYGSIDIHRFNN